jgi:hypothetical protein
VGVAEDLDLLESSIRQIQIEWDKFFGGIEKKPPSDLKTKLEALIRRYASQEMKNSTERFRYQSLSTRYSTLNELWNKKVRALEEGRIAGLHLTPAMAHMLHVPIPALTPDFFKPPADPILDASAPKRAAAAPARPAPAEVRVSDPRRDAQAIQALYERFVAARKTTGEPAVKLESFQSLIGQQTSKILADKAAHAVEFRIETKDGKVSLKAKPIR